MILIFLSITDQLFYRMSLSWVLSTVVFIITVGLWLIWRKTTEAKFHFHHTLWRCVRQFSITMTKYLRKINLKEERFILACFHCCQLMVPLLHCFWARSWQSSEATTLGNTFIPQRGNGSRTRCLLLGLVSGNLQMNYVWLPQMSTTFQTPLPSRVQAPTTGFGGIFTISIIL